MDKRFWRLTAPTLLAVGASAVTAAGLCCAMIAASCFMDGDPSRYPVGFPVSAVGAAVCLGALLLLAALYIRMRKKTPSLWLTVGDVLVGLALLLPFFWGWLKLSAYIM